MDDWDDYQEDLERFSKSNNSNTRMPYQPRIVNKSIKLKPE